MEAPWPARPVPSRQTAVNITAWLVEGYTLHQAGRWAEAERIYKQILAAQPGHFDSLHLLAVLSYERGEYAQALGQIALLLAKDPDNSTVLNHRGLALSALKRFEEAVVSYDRALAVQPDYVEALCHRGDALKELGRLEEALASYDRAIARRADYADAFCNRGVVLHKMRRYDEALANYDRALELRPDFAEAQVHRGNALRAQKRFEEALASSERVLTLWPDRAAAHGNLGIVLHELERFDDALASYERAFSIEPNLADVLCNRGATLCELYRFAEALASYERALALQPDLAQAHFNEAHCRLLLGDIARGFEKFEWRWKIEPYIDGRRQFVQPEWLGSGEIAGRTVLLYAADGFGDTLHFCRYVPLVAARGARVILEVQEPLRELMGSLAGGARVFAKGDPLPDFDLHCTLLGLARSLGTDLATIPAATPYLHASPAAVSSWNARLGRRDRPRVGLAWSGNPLHNNDRNRSIELRSLLPLLSGIDATFVSLQQELRAGDALVLESDSEILHFGAELKNYSDTAALISNLDLVISVDTSVAHLAGALAKPLWILLPYIPDWRWMLDREDSPWYPTARLFRQGETRTWDNVIARARAALQDYVRSAQGLPR